MIWYFNSKEAYEYPSMKAIANPKSNFLNFDESKANNTGLYYYLRFMKNNEIDNLTIIFSLDHFIVEYGNNNDINKDFCDKNSIDYKFDARTGGCMVLFQGNVVVQDVRPSITFHLQYECLEDFADWLQAKGISEVETNGNDVLARGRKVVGAVSETLPEQFKGYMYFGIQVSINADAELINNICTKPMEKIPGALSDYGITTEEVRDWLLEWFDKHRYEDK